MKAQMLLALASLSISAAQAAEPETLTLACEGTATLATADAKPEPISMGIVVNFTARTVTGFTHPGSNVPVAITGYDESSDSVRRVKQDMERWRGNRSRYRESRGNVNSFQSANGLHNVVNDLRPKMQASTTDILGSETGAWLAS